MRGETYAYWYLRRHGYVIIARNFTVRGMKGEIDLVGYDGETLAFVEVKTRTSERTDFGAPEDIAYGILYLISDESRFVTGAELVIDGGMNAI